jgi:hypothetical protein
MPRAGREVADALLDEGRPELALFAAWAMHERHGIRAHSVVRRALDLANLLPASLREAQRVPFSQCCPKE